MKTPKTYELWAEEAFEAFNEALQLMEERRCIINDKYEIFRQAPLMASFKRNINGTDRGINMLSVINEIIERDFSVDSEAKYNYFFYFVFAYVHCHTFADFITEKEADNIMEYINDNYNLFEIA